MSKSILITGGTGAFGKAFVERLLNGAEYDRICIYSRDEYKQAMMRDQFNDNQRLRFFIGDVRDKERLSQAMRGINDVVHAAALKRIEVGAYNPGEMCKTNVIGTMNVVEAAADQKVERVVTLSSDKAYQPISAYGQSKALAESLTLAANHVYGVHGPRYAATRYGNVANSTGSVIPRWIAAIESGDEIVVTDPYCTRFWMTQEEAVGLILDTLEEMPSDRAAIPILPAFELGDLVKAMEIKVARYIGLPAWEKKHEGMCDGNTSDTARRMTVDEIKEALKRV